MKMIEDLARAELDGERIILSAAARFQFGETYRLWSGVGDLIIPDIDAEPFTGIMARALLAPASTQVGGAAGGLTITLSGLDPDVAQTIEAEDYAQKPCTIWRLIFAQDGSTLLGKTVFMRGRVDTIVIREKVGGEAALDFAIEGARRDMDRSGGRIVSNTDQRVLGGAGDAAAKYIGTAAEKTLNWGQKPSTIAGSAAQAHQRQVALSMLRIL